MKSLYQLIVTPSGERYNNKTHSGLILNANIDEKDFRYTNRIGLVKETPMIPTPFKVDDQVLVHHNVFRQYWGFNTHLRTSSNDLTNGTFVVPLDSVFAYRRGDSDWIMFEHWILVEPIEAPRGAITYELKVEATRRGKLAYGDVDGAHIGDTVAYRPGGEYEFNIDGKKYYKMKRKDITCKIF